MRLLSHRFFRGSSFVPISKQWRSLRDKLIQELKPTIEIRSDVRASVYPNSRRDQVRESREI